MLVSVLFIPPSYCTGGEQLQIRSLIPLFSSRHNRQIVRLLPLQQKQYTVKLETLLEKYTQLLVLHELWFISGFYAFLLFPTTFPVDAPQ